MKKKQDMVYRYIFGPVPSRRLGRSLGLDIIPHKTCTLDCVYCECGRTTHLTVERKEYTPLGRIKKELETFLSPGPELDFITFSGAGEPTLHNGIKEIIRFLKTAYPEYKLALLTNGTLFNNSDTRSEILDLDLVKISMDAVYKKNFRRINRPHRDLELTGIIEGVMALRKVFKKKFWVEVFLVSGYNDSDVELKQIRNVLNMLAPDRIQLNTLDRPGTEPWVKPVDAKVLTEIADYLYSAEVITYFKAEHNIQTVAEDFDECLLATVKRRPCTADDIARVLDVDLNLVQRHLYALTKNGAITQKEMPRGIFYMICQQI
ncbi:MAG: radical SAM protein [Proteobacteria bacterium]|nr:radical SAM protein [Pseudomonadota bacterium]